ncbi:MAG: ABC transporter permease [Anaerolineales bacterium]|jgi:ABC-2 type transport system permease protein
MRNIWTIARREYRHYFISPIAYVVALVVLLVIGIFFVVNIYYAGAQGLYSGASAPDISIVIGPLSTVFLLTSPALTMRLLADEQRMGTMELLLTAPLRDWELVVGKWLGALLFSLTLIAITLIFPIVLNQLVTPGIDQGVMMAAYVAIILLVMTFLALGIAVSAIFSNQFAAFFGALILLMVFWYLIRLPTYITQVSSIINFFTYLDLNGRFSNLLTGQVALSDIIYPLSLTAFGLFVATVVVEMRRWQ